MSIFMCPLHGSQPCHGKWACITQCSYKPCHAGQPKMDGSWVLISKFRFKLKNVGKATRPFMYDLNQSTCQIQWKWWLDSKVKILQARIQQYKNWEFPNVQTKFRKGIRTRNQIASIHWIMEKTRVFREKKKKTYISLSLTMLNFWLCGSKQTVQNS